MQNLQISEVEFHKHLGIYLSNYCTWHHHKKYISEKAWGRINVMRKLKFKLDRKSLETIYTAFIRPLLENGDAIWDNWSQYEKQELEKIQLEAVRIATNQAYFYYRIVQRSWTGVTWTETWLYFSKCFPSNSSVLILPYTTISQWHVTI